MKKTLIFATAAMAMASAFADFSFAYLDTEGAKQTATPNAAAYTAYFCTVASAAEFFGGNSGFAEVTDWMKADAGNYSAGMTKMEAEGTAMALDGFDDGVYTFYTPFKQSGEGSLLDGSYLAVVSYSDAAGDMFRVFESEASGGKMAFKLTTEGGTAGAWTAVAPEPTSGLLLLLGVAGFALKRKVVG